MKEENKIAQARFGDKVKVNFVCKLGDGTIFDSTDGREPLQFTIGKGEVFRGLEEAVIGMSLNESKQVKVPAGKAFGLPLKEKVRIISKDQFPSNLKPEVGMQFRIQQADGQTGTITVADVTESSVTLDANHPLAGKDLFLDVELIEIEETDLSRAYEYYTEGIAFQDREQHDEAIQSYQKAIKLNPGFAPAYFNLGVAFQKKGQPDEAFLFYELATGFNPNYAEAHYNLGIILKEKGKLDEAIICFETALQSRPRYAGAYYNLGNILVAKGKLHEALPYYQETISLNPDYAEAHWNIALINLLFGDFEKGWKGYEWRWKLEGIPVKRNFTQPKWNGSDISGRTILLHAEQGLGDTIHFIRYASLVADRGAKIMVECQKELVSLLKNVDGINEVIEQGMELPPFDFHCPLLSLPLTFGTTIESIPSRIPYIEADSALVGKWRNKIGPGDSRLRVGLVWAGDQELKGDSDRSCSLETFSTLARFDNISFYSLQKGSASPDAKNAVEDVKLIDYTADIRDFSDTAALIENLDLVISVDTAVAHLAGAMGKPAWTLIPFVPDWRWMLDREDSPWYPTMRLFRQPARGDWEAVITKLSETLETFNKNDIRLL